MAAAQAAGSFCSQDFQVDQVSFEIHGVTTWLTSNCKRHIGQYLKK